MSVTCANLINPAMRMAGISKLPGTGPGADQYAEAMPALNRMMSSLSLNGQYIFTSEVNDYGWGSGVASKTFGPTGDEVLAREPLYIDTCNWVLPGTSGNSEVVLHMTPVRTAGEWQAITMPNLNTDFPRFFYPQQGQGAFPQNTKVSIWTVPITASILRMETRTALKSNFTSTSDIAYFPDGYEETITFNFALRLHALYASQFQHAVLQPGTRELAASSLRAVLASHVVSPQRTSDADDINADSPTTVDNLEQRINFFSGWQS